MTKLLRITLDSMESIVESGESVYCNLGGRALTSRIIALEVKPDCDPLGPKNKLVFAPGLLAGTNVPNTGRLSIGAKSPLTGGIKEANAGGIAARKMARLDLSCIVLEGEAESLTIIKVDRNGVAFLPGEPLQMRGIKETIDYCQTHFGSGCGIIAIGQGGEMELTAAGIAVTSSDNYPRMAARGGLGAVMGAKGIKAIVLDDSDCAHPQIKNPPLLNEAAKALTKGITSHPLAEGLKLFGTPVLVNMINELGALSTRNYSQGQFEGAEKISGEYIAELLNSRPNSANKHRCMPGCVMNCSNVYTDEKGDVVVSGLEYETLALMGANCMIDDVDIIAAMNAVCNDFGLDTMDVGGAVAVAMEMGVLPWGDGKCALEMIGDIITGKDECLMLGMGVKYTGEKLGCKRIPHVKGQCLSGYDPRIVKGTGVTYATSTMGADHTCGNALPSPANPDYDPSSPDGQAEVSQFLQRYFAAIDALGFCLFASLPLLDDPSLQKHLIDCVSAVLDESLEEQYLVRLGALIVEEERKFNLAAGISKDQDRLPRFFRAEPIGMQSFVFDVPDKDLESVHG